MAVSIELGKKLDKDYEGKSLEEILDAPPSALAGLTDKHAELLAGWESRPSGTSAATSTLPWQASWWRCPTTPTKALADTSKRSGRITSSGRTLLCAIREHPY